MISVYCEIQSECVSKTVGNVCDRRVSLLVKDHDRDEQDEAYSSGGNTSAS